MVAGSLILQGANGVRLQAERIRARLSDDPHDWTRDGEPLYVKRLDAEFFVLALWRTMQGVRYGDDHSTSFDRKAAELLKQVRIVVGRDLAHVRTMRDVIDHIDAYEAPQGVLRKRDLTALIGVGPMYGKDLPEPRISIGVSRYRPADGVPAPGTMDEPHDVENSVIWVDQVEAIVSEYVDPLLCHLYRLAPGGHTLLRVKL